MSEHIKPELSKYNPDPQYIRYVIRTKGVSITEAAKLIGMPRTTLRDKLNPALKTSVSYAEQYALESL